MAARGNIPAAFEGRSVQGPGMLRHGPYPGVSSAAGHPSLEPLPSQLFGNKIVSQEAEIQQLVGDNRRLASTHVALREELVTAHQEVQKLRAHIRSIQTESDIQIRVLLDKIAKMEADIRAGEGVKKELQLAHLEAQNLVAARQELKGRIERATQELKKVCVDVSSLADLQAELDSLVEEHQILRTTFQYEKSKNVELVEQLKATEKNLIAMAREIELLRAEIQNVEKRTHAPNRYGAATGTFVGAYGRAQGQTQPVVDQVGETAMVYGGRDDSGVAAATSAAWTGPYDSSVSRK